MAKLNDEMKKLLEETPIWVLATADSSNVPNAVPIHWSKAMSDDQMMLVDNFMRKTVDNINANPKVSVSVWKGKTGFQFKGNARIETSGPIFDAGVEMVKKGNPKLNPKGVVVVDIDSIYITTPGPDAGKKID